MLKAAVVLCLAAAATAISVHPEKNVPEQTIRIGHIGSNFANLKAVITPTTSAFMKGVPGYELTRIVDGAPSVEANKYFFRCSVFDALQVPSVNSDRPLLLCRSEGSGTEGAVDSAVTRTSFLLSAEDFVLPEGVHDIGLSVGHNVWKTVIHPAVTSGVVRESRQFGGGFSGSGAQAGASSFGGGGGFGGFPGGGFGGGFSGSQASAGAGSFGGGGGFFG